MKNSSKFYGTEPESKCCSIFQKGKERINRNLFFALLLFSQGMHACLNGHVYLNPQLFPLIKPVQTQKKDKLLVILKKKCKALVWRIATCTAILSV